MFRFTNMEFITIFITCICLYLYKGIEFLPQILNFIIPISQQPDDAYLSYFKLTLYDSPEFKF